MSVYFDHSRFEEFCKGYKELITENNKGVRVQDLACHIQRDSRTIKRWFVNGELAKKLNSLFIIENNIVYSKQYELTKENVIELHRKSHRYSIDDNVSLFRDAFNLLIQKYSDLTYPFVPVSQIANHLNVTPRTIQRWFKHGNAMRKQLKHEFVFHRNCIFSVQNFRNYIDSFCGD